jgi:ribonuclease HI
METIIAYTDGGSRGNPGPSGIGVFVTDAKGKVLKKISKYLGTQTNNFAEYEAVIMALEEIKKLFGAAKLKNIKIEIRSDSLLVVSQLSGEYQIKEPTLFPQFIKIWNMRVKDIPNISFLHIPREKNPEADKLANEAMDSGVKGPRKMEGIW